MARPTEVKVITALLEAEHEDVEQLARAVIETLDQLRLSRPTFAIRLSWDDDERFGIGPFENRQRAREHLKTLGLARTRKDEETGQRVMELLDGGHPDQVIVELKPLGWWTGEVATPQKGTCPDCGHPTHCHDWPKYAKKRQGCIVSLSPRGEVGANLCPCEGSGA